MTRYCISCGSALAEGARFCGGCGSAVASVPDISVAAPETAVTQLPPVEYIPPQSEPDASIEQYTAVEEEERKGPNWLLIGGGAAILLLLVLYYFIFIRDDIPSNPAVAAPVAKEEAKTEEVEAQQYFAVADANIRDKPTAQSSSILGKLLRGTEASGSLVNGEDGTSQWLKLSDDKGYIGMVNLSETKPPVLSKLLGDRKWIADKPLSIVSQPDTGATVLDQVAAGAELTLYGLTDNGYIEIKLRKGGVGYLADAERILAAPAVLGKPITISFNPSTCNFGGELEAEFERLSKRVRAAYDVSEKAEYPNDAARDKALAALEGKSSYQKLQRSFNGLSITGIAQHYESQSVYIADPPEKVLAAFRGAGFKIGKDGNFLSSEISSSISASSSDARAYGKSELSCGV